VGVKVFEETISIRRIRPCWDGNQNGMPVGTGTYVYFVEMECPSGGLLTGKYGYSYPLEFADTKNFRHAVSGC
jgi:hypothetical protein